jgi:hypothetical protein
VPRAAAPRRSDALCRSAAGRAACCPSLPPSPPPLGPPASRFRLFTAAGLFAAIRRPPRPGEADQKRQVLGRVIGQEPQHPALPMCGLVGTGNSSANNVIARAITASEK